MYNNNLLLRQLLPNKFIFTLINGYDKIVKMEMENKKPKVLVTYIEAGYGHIVSAKALSESLKNKYGNEIDVVDVYVSENNEDVKKFENYLVAEVKRTNKIKGYGSLQLSAMHIIGSQNSLKLVHSTIFKNAKKSVIELYDKYKPDMVVSTHFSPQHFAVEYRNSTLHNLLVANYNPDPNVHGWWDNRGDLFMVNNHYAYLEAIKNKFNPNTIKRVGFTIRQSIVNCNLTREQLREKFNLPQNNFTICLADGAYATAKLKSYTNELLKCKHNITLLVIAGKNKKVYDYFVQKQQMGKIPSNITLKVFEFVDYAHELYGASDVFITKAGPNAIQDSLFMGTPVLVNYYATVIENITQKLFTQVYKCGTTILDKQTMRKTIEKWIKHPKELNKYKQNCKRFDKTKNGADDAADHIYNLLKYQKPHLFKNKSINQ